MIYIDNEFKCHVENDGTMTEVETPDILQGKCSAFVEGYRFVPEGQSWTREDGVTFHGEMIAPWKNYTALAAYQEQYEAMLPELQDMKEALNVLGVTADG